MSWLLYLLAAAFTGFVVVPAILRLLDRLFP